MFTGGDGGKRGGQKLLKGADFEGQSFKTWTDPATLISFGFDVVDIDSCYGYLHTGML